MHERPSIWNKWVTFFRKTLKVFLWMVISMVLLLVLFVLLIQIPVVQMKAVQYATSFISSKTHTKVEIKKVGISFPKSVTLEGLYLEDLQKDTFLYAVKAKINMSLYGLFSHKIAISSLSLEGGTLKLYRNEPDPLFNYNFLLNAFRDTTRQIEPGIPTPSKWIFSLDQVNLQHFRISYNDASTGMNIVAVLKNSEFNMKVIDTRNALYDVGDLIIDGSTVNIHVKEAANIHGIVSDGVSPTVTAQKIRVLHSNVNYTDSVYYNSVSLVIDSSGMEEVSIDFQNQLLTLDNLYLSKSKIQHHSFTPEALTNVTFELPIPLSGNNWKVSTDHIVMNDNIFIHKSGNKQGIKNAFTGDFLEYNHLILDAADFYYSSDEIKFSMKKFSAVDQNNFAIWLEGDISENQHSITATKLKANTSDCRIEADLNIEYAIPGTLMDSKQISSINVSLKKVSIRNSDILYFNPQLIRYTFFKNPMNTTTLSGSIAGPLNNLNGKNLVIHTGVNTIIKTNFTIRGLPDYQTASYNFPDLSIISGKKDIEMIAGPLMPENIELPENINIQLVFKGVIKSFESTARISSSFGAGQLFAAIDHNENFRSTIKLIDFDLGSLLKKQAMLGPVSLTAEASGQGLDSKTIRAEINADVSQIFLNKYNYRNLSLDGSISGREFAGKINLNDSNAVLDLDGLINLKPNQERYKFHLNIQGADLQKLNLTRNDFRIGLVAESDLKSSGPANLMNGTAGIYNVIIARGDKKYFLDSLLFASINEPDKNELKSGSALMGLKYSGTVSPADFSMQLKNFIDNYFPFPNGNSLKEKIEPSDFNVEIQLHNHPLFTQVLLPELKEFEPGVIEGSFDGQKNDLKLNIKVKKIVYGNTEIKDFAVDVHSDAKALNYKISSSNISNSYMAFDDFSFDGKLADNKITSNIYSTDGRQNKKLLIRSVITRDMDNYKLTLDPEEFYLMDKRWNIAADNYIEFGKQGFLVHHLFMEHAESIINIASVHDRFNDDLNIAIQNFKLDDISRIIEKDTSLVKGKVEGNILLKRDNNTYGLIADAKISDLVVREVPIGNLSLKAENPTTGKFDIAVDLTGPGNKISANGYLITTNGNNSFNIETRIDSLSMKSVEAFSMGEITEAAGTLAGNLFIEGSFAVPQVTGELVFNDVFIKPAALNNRLGLKHETVRFKKDGIYFDSFTLSDTEQHNAIIDGAVYMMQFKDFIFALQLSTQDFLLLNTTAKDNKEFFGRMVVDSKIEINGPMALPVVDAKIKMKKGSNFTFVVPDDKLTTDKGEDVVAFEDSLTLNAILNRGLKKETLKSGITGFDLTSIIEIDKEATLRLLLDPASTDVLVVKGEAALSFTMDRSGKLSLTGAYNLDEGSYLISLESAIKKKFDINAGSTIIWDGDPLAAKISIDASYSVRASPFDLVADQMSGLSDMERGGYKQRYPFLVLLKLRGEILHPVISFEIQLPPEDKGILGGAVNQKLSMLNEDPSALNKQVFALLILGRFVQENPFQTESTGTSTLIRSTVGKFLSTQLNLLSSKALPGMGLNFNIQSYDDYQSGQPIGRTQVEIGLKKQLFKERLSVQLGGSIDVEGDRAKQNSASDITGDVTVEYKMTRDGRLRLKGFRHNQYEGAIEGQLVETGVGIIFVRDFNRWNRLFKSQRSRTDSLIKQKRNVTINPE